MLLSNPLANFITFLEQVIFKFYLSHDFSICTDPPLQTRSMGLLHVASYIRLSVIRAAIHWEQGS